jgi:protein TonB
MFADALLDSRIDRSCRGWATLTSFGVQAVAVTCLFVLPLFYTQVLPRLESVSHVIAPPLGAPPVEAQPSTLTSGGGQSIYTTIQTQTLHTPGSIPRVIASGTDVTAPDIPFGPGGPGARGTVLDEVTGGTGNAVVPVIPRGPEAAAPRISVMMEGSLIHRVEPQYPMVAKTAGIQGSVVLAAIIGRDGTVQNLRVLSGHPFLVRAAAIAVRDWRYRPYILNGTPVEVETRITVNFVLSR